MSTEREIELTFLASMLPQDLDQAQHVVIEDIYIPEDDEFPPLRLRRKGDMFEITRKMPAVTGDYSQHIEHTIPLDQKTYEILSQVSARRLRKKRYLTIIANMPAEVDVFEDELEGLVLIEFEFTAKSALENFQKPTECLIDVTQDRQILGGQLAGKSYDDIKGWLESKGYTKLV